MAKAKTEEKTAEFEGVDIGGGDQTSGLMVDLNEVEDQACECAPELLRLEFLLGRYNRSPGYPEPVRHITRFF